MKILILGGGGAQARVATMDLLKNPDVQEVVLGDINLEAAKSTANELRTDRVKPKLVDVSDHAMLVKLMRDFDAVANGIVYTKNVPVLKAAIEAGVNLTDLGGMYHVILEEMRFAEAAKDAGITVVLGSGISPGTMNIMAKYGASQLDSVDSIKLYLGGKLLEPATRLAFAFSIAAILDELTSKPMIYRDGKPMEMEPLSGKEAYVFPEPVGEVKHLYYSLTSEVATLPRTIKGVKNVEYKIDRSESLVEIVNLLARLGLTDPTPIKVGGVEISPRQFLIEELTRTTGGTKSFVEDVRNYRVVVSGKKKQDDVTHIFDHTVHARRESKTRATHVATGIPVSIVTQMLARNEIGMKGVYSVEECLQPEPYFAELAKRELYVKQTTITHRNVP